MSAAISINDLPSLVDYATQRERLRADAIATKAKRRIAIGDNVSLLFENRLTVQYQVMEMLRVEKTTAPAAIQEELDAYNPLLPDGRNWKATMLIEFEDAGERRVQLKAMRNVEHHVFAEIGGIRITALADEDMERSDDEKTSAVHFLRFELPEPAVHALRDGATLRFGIEHPRYNYSNRVDDPAVIASLLDDLAG